MLRWIGASLIVIGAGIFARSLISSAREQVEMLKAICRDLEYMRSEMEFHLLPLPEIFRSLESRTHPSLQEFYLAVCDHASEFPGQDAGASIIQSAGCMKGLPQEAVSLLFTAFADLGRQDTGRQTRILEEASETLKTIILKKESAQREQERTCKTLCICAGLALAIILF